MPIRSEFRITKRSVDALRATGKGTVLWDRDLPGFGVRVHGTGRKVYVVQARGPAGSKRVTLGWHGELAPIQARKQAGIVIGRIKRGEDPKPKSPEPQPNVAGLAERFMRVHVAPNCKATTAELYRGFIDNHILPTLGGKPIGSVGREDVAALHFELRDRPGTANGTIQVLSQMFRRAEEWGLTPKGNNPCRSIRKYRLRPRERYLTEDEYGRLGRVLKDGEANGSIAKPAVAALRLLMLTGCRRDEILTLRWDDVDRSARELRLRDSKTGPVMVALTSAVESVLDGIERVPGNPWVFTGTQRGRRLMTLKSTWRRVQKRADVEGVEGVRLHDLRHSYASRVLALGESLPMIGKLLNQVQMQTTARYAHLMLDAEKAAAARVGDTIAAQVAGYRSE